jgi:hypothetical protein
VADAALTPELALRYLDQLSTDIRAALLLDKSGAVAAASGRLADQREPAAELVRQLFARADEAAAEQAAGGEPPVQVEVTLPTGAVFAARDGGWTIAAVTSRLVLSSLMFYDLRSVLSDLDRRAA